MGDLVIEKRLINLNSNNATKFNGTFLSDVNFNFTSILKEDDSIVNIQGGVLDAVIPVSYYTVNYSNNILSYNVNSITYSITINVGNYNFNTLETEILAEFLLNGHTFSLTINKNNGIVTFTLVSVGIFNSFNYVGSTCFKILGFDPLTNYTATANVLTAPYLLNLLGFKKIKICSTIFSINSSDSAGLTNNNFICSIPVSSTSYGLIIYNNIDTTYGRLNTRHISNIDIQLKNEDNVFINFNNTDWSLTLTLFIYRKVVKDRIQPLILETLQSINDTLQQESQVTQLDTQDTQQDTSDIQQDTQPQDLDVMPQDLDVGDASTLDIPLMKPLAKNDNEMQILNF